MLCDVEMFFFYCVGDHRDLHVMTHSFPTRRSSDLAVPLLDLLHLKARKAIGDLDPLARLAVLRRERTKQPAIFGQRHFDGTAKGDGADDVQIMIHGLSPNHRRGVIRGGVKNDRSMVFDGDAAGAGPSREWYRLARRRRFGGPAPGPRRGEGMPAVAFTGR